MSLSVLKDPSGDVVLVGPDNIVALELHAGGATAHLLGGQSIELGREQAEQLLAEGRWRQAKVTLPPAAPKSEPPKKAEPTKGKAAAD